MEKVSIRTQESCEFIDITSRVQEIVSSLDIESGICLIFVPHTTAAVTINENADPDVVSDITSTLERVVPIRGRYDHGEGNAAAHIKASIIGSSVSVIVRNGKLQLGRWQGIFLTEFDGPRTREVWIKMLQD